jgi:L-fuculose-phosphate aldolase
MIDEAVLRRAIVDACRQMNAIGINQGTSGNISARLGDALLVTPSGVPYDELRPEDLPVMTLTGEHGAWAGPLRPSSEWRFHVDIMKARPEVGAIVHTHSLYATTLAIARKEIPACHYMIAAAGGPTIRCATYATFGTAELSAAALVALEGRTCCLLANHGMIATGPDLKKAMWLAVELETIAKQYYLSLCIGGPVILSDAEIATVQERFRSYGPRPRDAVEPTTARKKGRKAA